MKIIRGLARARGVFRRPIVTIGNFDGVHRGHQVIIQQAREDAAQRGTLAVAVTFDPHPVAVLRPDVAPRLLMTLGDRLSALSAAGLDATVVQRFSRDFASIEASDFVKDFIVDCLDTQKIVVGHDINFGRNRAGSTSLLVDEGAHYGFDVEVIRPVVVDDIVVHSSNVRQAVAAGDVALASRLLGRPHFVRGRCVKGDARGRDLGFPTVNLKAKTQLSPCDGVYATFALVDGRRVQAVTSIGSKPTFDGKETAVEAHLFDFDEDLYGANITIEFVERVRDQRKFDGADALVEQVHKDVEESRRILSRHAATAGGSQD